MIKIVLQFRDRDQDGSSSQHCAEKWTGGWWHNFCFEAHPTGLSSATRKTGLEYIVYYWAGDRGNTWDSWAEAEYLIVPGTAPPTTTTTTTTTTITTGLTG